MRHARNAHEFLEILRDELRAIVRDEPRFRAGVLFTCTLRNTLDVQFGHRFTYFPMHDGAAFAIEQRAQVIKRARDVEVRNIDVPMLMSPQGLRKPRALSRRAFLPPIESSSLRQDAIDGRGADGDDVLVEHHERQASISFEWILRVKLEDRIFFFLGEPEVARYIRVMLVCLAIPFLPIVKLTFGNPDPAHEFFAWKFGFLGPNADEIDNFITRIVRNPLAAQSPPNSFFSLTYSSEISAMTSSFLVNLASSCAMRASSSCSRLGLLV